MFAAFCFFYIPMGLVIGFAAAAISASAWPFMVPVLLSFELFSDFDNVFDAILLSITVDLANAALLTWLYCRKGGLLLAVKRAASGAANLCSPPLPLFCLPLRLNAVGERVPTNCQTVPLTHYTGQARARPGRCGGRACDRGGGGGAVRAGQAAGPAAADVRLRALRIRGDIFD